MRREDYNHLYTKSLPDTLLRLTRNVPGFGGVNLTFIAVRKFNGYFHAISPDKCVFKIHHTVVEVVK